MSARRTSLGILSAAVLASIQPAQDAQPEAPEPEASRETFPHVRVDASARRVELEGIVPIDCHDEETPHVYLEVVACTPGTKEHEALVMTRARASHVHAALLAIGLEPGVPGSWKWDGQQVSSVAPEGPPVSITISYENDEGETVKADAREWIVNVEDDETFGKDDGDGWVFAGSRFVNRGGREVYDADGTGLIVGLTTFGSEVVAWTEVISHEAQVHETEWIANRDLVPAYKTPVTLIIEATAPAADTVKP